MKKLWVVCCFLLYSCTNQESKEAAPTTENLIVDESVYTSARMSPIEIKEYLNVYNDSYVYIGNKKYHVYSVYIGDFEKAMDTINNSLNHGDSIPVTMFSNLIYLPGKDGKLNFIIIDGKEGSLSISYGEKIGIGYEEESFNFTHSAADVKIESIIYPEDEEIEIYIKTTLYPEKNGKTNKNIDIEVSLNELGFFGTGTAQFKLVDDTRLSIEQGSLGVSSYATLDEYLRLHPNIDTLVFKVCDGSIDDQINVETGRLIRKHGLTTMVEKNSDIVSGAVDLFASGVKRVYTDGAKIGVHSWCCSESGEDVQLLAKNDEAHYSQLGYFTEMLGNKGKGFYFFTLQAADFDDIYFMKKEEIAKYGLATDFVD